jgi:hypothetical protein
LRMGAAPDTGNVNAQVAVLQNGLHR